MKIIQKGFKGKQSNNDNNQQRKRKMLPNDKSKKNSFQKKIKTTKNGKEGKNLVDGEKKSKTFALIESSKQKWEVLRNTKEKEEREKLVEELLQMIGGNMLKVGLFFFFYCNFSFFSP